MLTLFLSFLLVCGLYSFSSVFRLPFSWWQSTEISKSPMCNPHCPKQTPNLFFQLLNKIPVLHFDWTPPEPVLWPRGCLRGIQCYLRKQRVGEIPPNPLGCGWERSPPTHRAAHGKDKDSPTSISCCRNPANLHLFTKNVNAQEDLPSET